MTTLATVLLVLAAVGTVLAAVVTIPKLWRARRRSEPEQPATPAALYDPEQRHREIDEALQLAAEKHGKEGES
jgi:hypothetical protein